MPLLHNGETFTQLSIPKIGGGMLSLPDDLKGSFGVVLIYRGAWCPYCNAQLSGFERASAKLAEIGVKIAAFSVDDEATTAALVAKTVFVIPSASAPTRERSPRGSAPTSTKSRFLQTTGFVLAPDGSVVNAVYSSGAIGGLVADGVVGLVAYLKSNTR